MYILINENHDNEYISNVATLHPEQVWHILFTLVLILGILYMV
jgi:hypothetical protein